MIPTHDNELFDWIAANLYTAVLSDSCDQLGYMEQAMGPEIRPADEALVLAGRAKTVLWADMYHVPENPYEGEIQAVDSIMPGDIVVMATGASKRNAPWGEWMSTGCVKRGGRGAGAEGRLRG